MRLTILIFFITFCFSGFSQHMITDSTFYDDGKLMSFGKYDSLRKYWKLYGFYENGQIESTRELSPIYFWDVDTYIIYHRNGKVAWIFPYTDSGFLTGKLIGYYKDGTIKREAYYYRGFRTGTWKEYYQNGKINSISQYEITPKDSAFAFRMPTNEDYKKDFAKPEYVLNYEPEYFWWGEREPYDTIFENGVRYGGPTLLTSSTLISKKTGKWKTYDFSGKLRNKRLTTFDTTYMIRKLIGQYALSSQTVEDIYERCNSLEELAQMLGENDKEHNMTEFLKDWNEASAGFLEDLNEPRLALGLERLTFKGRPIQKN